MTEDDTTNQFNEIVARMDKVGLAGLKEPDFETMTGYFEQRRLEWKAAERAHVVPGLDVPWFHDLPPIKVWDHQGIVCAYQATPTQPGLNGYVLLPRDHPWAKFDLQGLDEGVPDVDVHGGVTMHHHATGWIGFDTAHAGDHWHPAEIVQVEIPTDYLRRWARTSELMADLELTLGGSARNPWDKWWTVEDLMSEVNHLADQVKEAMPQ